MEEESAILLLFNFLLVNEYQIFTFQVDNFLVCEDEASDDDDIEEDTVLDPLLKDEFLSSTYSPSAPTTPSTSKSKEIKDNSSQDTKFKVDLGEDYHEAKEICYLSAGNKIKIISTYSGTSPLAHLFSGNTSILATQTLVPKN